LLPLAPPPAPEEPLIELPNPELAELGRDGELLLLAADDEALRGRDDEKSWKDIVI
jgi:hypothetical protein